MSEVPANQCITWTIFFAETWGRNQVENMKVWFLPNTRMWNWPNLEEEWQLLGCCHMNSSHRHVILSEMSFSRWELDSLSKADNHFPKKFSIHVMCSNDTCNGEVVLWGKKVNNEWNYQDGTLKSDHRLNTNRQHLDSQTMFWYIINFIRDDALTTIFFIIERLSTHKWQRS